MKRQTLLVLFLAVCICLAGGCKKSKAKQRRAAQTQQDVVVHTTTIHEAAATGNISWIKVLLEQGVSPNARNAQGETPLLVAIKAGNSRSVAFLLQNGADRNEEQADGHPLWVEESARMTPEILRFMLPGDAPAEHIYQALNEAISHSPYERVVEELLAVAETQPDFAKQCFWPAALQSTNQMVVDSLLIRNILPVNGCGGADTPPLISAIQAGNEKLTASLMLLGADPARRDSAGYTAAYYAMKAGWSDVANQLMREEERKRAEHYAAVLARKRAAARARSGAGQCRIRKSDGTTVPCPQL